MRAKLWIAAIALLSTSACNYTVGECWPASQGIGDSTVAGGPIIPGGVGGGSLGDSPSGATGGGTRFPEADCNSKPKEPETPAPNAGGQGDQCGTLPGTEGGSANNGATYTFCAGPCAAKCAAMGLMGSFSESIFAFVTTVADDGTDVAGGWQEVTVALWFDRWISVLPEKWSCSVTIGMALRTEVYGKISSQKAASVTKDIADQASTFAMHNPEGVPSGIFCVNFKKKMKELFKKQPFGARVNQ